MPIEERTAQAVDAILLRQHGVITWQQARRHLSEKAIRHRVRSGRWRRVHRGIYLAHSESCTRQQYLWVASLGAGNGRPALLAGVTALQVLGLQRLPADPLPIHVLVHISRPDRDPPPGVRVHRTRRLSMVDVCPTIAPPCTTAARALVDAVEWATDGDDATRVLAAADGQRLVSPEQVRPVLARLPRLSRRRLLERALAA
ncbi:hypothetical protein ACWT_1839 [Actinoplanes sp. SE50]|uniref:type IV toxin-antitoxin system AbiEi family antitoxin domain-containing protein n=1 Tax=unclassified Actinoplanes TaxID=2626549 RepID=UPI00023EBB24|nr:MULTISPECIES: type IV toxin-antitoxin system AbiEi family antitoxin domain-containing protein [unclassified Actinoplanes]AEV82858.1 hypothetical protein ACPL_1961 [Actinoplanes sp. SE50/110]ATO81254.1 hypothetical protein ACWT_1839 [Actinoplanes sp. SE50]SLL98661.1 hypothetical protein ACSP50_1888 [Actinoplanes sp. SE50/110]